MTGKKPEDLPVDDTPITTPATPPEDDAVQEQAWYQLVARIDELLDIDRYAWAFDTLAGIKETVERTRRVSDGQRRAVDNIEARGSAPRSSSRRYEGYGSPWGRRRW